MGTIWQNKTRDIYIQKHGSDEFNKRARNASQVGYTYNYLY